MLESKGEFGRRDWTRTNDPHHVKMVAHDAYVIDFNGKTAKNSPLKTVKNGILRQIKSISYDAFGENFNPV